MPKIGSQIIVTNLKDDTDVVLSLMPTDEGTIHLLATVVGAEPGADPLFDADLGREDALAVSGEIKKRVEALPPPAPDSIAPGEEKTD